MYTVQANGIERIVIQKLPDKLEALNLQSQISEERANILFGSSRSV